MHLLVTMATDVAAEVATQATNIASLVSAVDTVWVLFATALVFLMQAGFAMVEAGFTPRQERWQHHHEKSYGLLYRRSRLLDHRLLVDVWPKQRVHRFG